MYKNMADKVTDDFIDEAVLDKMVADKTAIEQALISDSAVNAVLSKKKTPSLIAWVAMLDVDFTTKKGVKEAIRLQKAANDFFDMLVVIRDIIDDGTQAKEDSMALVSDDPAEETE